jgi:hypothetical protein
MRLSSARRFGFRGVSFIARPFDTKSITAGVGISHVDVGYIGILELLLDLGFDFSIGNILLGNQTPPSPISV